MDISNILTELRSKEKVYFCLDWEIGHNEDYKLFQFDLSDVSVSCRATYKAHLEICHGDRWHPDYDHLSDDELIVEDLEVINEASQNLIQLMTEEQVKEIKTILADKIIIE